MRLSFLLGGIAGAALVVYLTRKPELVEEAAGNIRHNVNHFMTSAGDKMKEMAHIIDQELGKREQVLTDHENGHYKQENDIAEIEHWLRNDPEARQQVEEILRDER